MALLTLGALAMIATIWWYYLQQRAAVEADAVHQLAAIAAMKSAQIENWRGERMGDGRVLAASPIRHAARRILAGGGVEADRVDMVTLFKALGREFLYSSAALVDGEGEVRIGFNVSRADSPRLKLLAQAAQRGGEVMLSDLYRDGPASSPVRMAVAIPIDGPGSIILDIDPSRFLYPYLASSPGGSRTGETLIFRRDGDYLEALSELRHAPGSALTFRQRIPVPKVPDERELAAGWMLKGLDYHGVPVINIVRHVQGSPWYLTAKIDQDEVYAPLSRLSGELFLIVALIAIATAAGVGYIWRNQQLHAYRERKAIVGHFDSLTRYANDIILLLDDDGRIVEANQRAARVYGYSEGELQSLSIQALLVAGPGDAPVWPVADEMEGVRYEALHRGKDGAPFPVDVSSRVIEVDGTKFHQSIIRDISERVRIEREIKALSARLINAQEEERARLARELHDDLSQQIAVLSIGMSNLKRAIPVEQNDAREQGERIQQKLVEISESIRRLSHELHPAVLKHSGLGVALRGCCSEFALLTNIQVTFTSDGSFESVPPSVALCLYRITQEALQNVAKHARTAEAAVELIRREGLLWLVVSDRGAGMEPNRGGLPAGLGLVSIKERTRLVNGTFEIQSGPNQGTTLRVKIPV